MDLLIYGDMMANSTHSRLVSSTVRISPAKRMCVSSAHFPEDFLLIDDDETVVVECCQCGIVANSNGTNCHCSFHHATFFTGNWNWPLATSKDF